MTVYDLGTITSNTSIKKENLTVTSSAKDDIFKFKTTESRSLNAMITGFGGEYADLELYRDSNGNGKLDIGTDQLMQRDLSFTGGGSDASINRWRGKGTYFARVFWAEDSLTPTVEYDIYVSATKNSSGNLTGPPNLLARENEISTFGNFDNTYTGSVGTASVNSGDDNDTSDIYYFTLGFGESVDITLNGLGNNADIRLIQDANLGRTAGAGETVSQSTNTGTNPDSIDWNTPGDYYLQVYTPGLTNTNYNLGFDFA